LRKTQRAAGFIPAAIALQGDSAITVAPGYRRNKSGSSLGLAAEPRYDLSTLILHISPMRNRGRTSRDVANLTDLQNENHV
jgi:hypothetical protein